ncbi:hypothetical protein [Anaerosolibacter sp.]|uniref:hypothetical protein n=1 Tax=Anaerosolibacter sp. TaxID=1872527 RepID=UPI0039EDFF82
MSLSNIPPSQFSLIAALLGITLSNNLNANQQNSLGNFLEALGQSMLTVSAQKQLQQSQQNSQNEKQQINLQIQLLKQQIELLEHQLKKND